MYASFEILASFLVIPVNINLRGVFYIYINIPCQLMSCNGMQALEIFKNALIPY